MQSEREKSAESVGSDLVVLPSEILTQFDNLSDFGHGDFSSLYTARHKDSGAKVLIKSIDLQRAESWKDIDLFVQQSHILRQLDHPCIPKFYDAFESDDARQFYIIQAYVEAPSLKTLLDEGKKWDEGECISIALQLCDILKVLQDFSPPIVHRDIKPSNILYNSQGQIYIIDFDLATARSEEVRGSTIAGTIGYMPPEQMMGRAGGAADIYASFATILHLLTGKDPGLMEVNGFRLDFEPYLPKQTSEEMLQLFRATLEPSVELRLSDVREIENHLHTITNEEARFSQWTQAMVDTGGNCSVYDMDFTAVQNIPKNLLRFPPTPRPVKDENITKLLSLEIANQMYLKDKKLFELFMDATFIIIPTIFIPLILDEAFRLPLDILYIMLIVFILSAIFVIFNNITNRKYSLIKFWKTREYYQQHRLSLDENNYNSEIIAFVKILKTWEQTTAVLDAKSPGGSFFKFHYSINGLRYDTGLKLLSGTHGAELFKGDEISILYDPQNPRSAIIFPGPIEIYIKREFTNTNDDLNIYPFTF